MQRRLAEIKQCTSVPEYLTAPMSRGGRENANLVGRVQPRALVACRLLLFLAGPITYSTRY